MPYQIHLTACAIALAGACTLAGVFPIPLPDGLDYAAHADCHANTARARIDSGPRQWLAVGLKGGQHLAWSDQDTLEWDFTGENLDLFFRQGDRPLSYVIDGQAVTGKIPPGYRSVHRLPRLAESPHLWLTHPFTLEMEIKRAEASQDTAMVPWSRTRAEGSMWMHPGAGATCLALRGSKNIEVTRALSPSRHPIANMRFRKENYCSTSRPKSVPPVLPPSGGHPAGGCHFRTARSTAKSPAGSSPASGVSAPCPAGNWMS